LSDTEISKSSKPSRPSAEPVKLNESSQACLDNAKRLLEDAEWCSDRPSTGTALAMLAQEECAKAFILILVRDQIIPWSQEIRRSLYSHNSKYVMIICMAWLSEKHMTRESAWLKSELQSAAESPRIPSEIAKAMNIYRHEMVEDQSRNIDSPRSEWNGIARRTARGKSDRRKQNALYIGIGPDAQVTSRPSTSTLDFDDELRRTKEILSFAEAVRYAVHFKFPEYDQFTGVFGSMFKDLAPDFDKTSVEERFPSEIPGIGLVRTIITVAEVEDEDSSKYA
jgi:AbiV family abortive infection protein